MRIFRQKADSYMYLFVEYTNHDLHKYKPQ